jgi:hypothetical protein
LVFCELYKFIAGQFVEFEALADYEEDEDGTAKSPADVVVNVA